MTAPETIWAINGGITRMSEVAIDHDDVEYTRTDLTIRRDDPALRQVMEAATDAVSSWDWWTTGQYDRCQSVPQSAIDDLRVVLAALKERIRGEE